ncbi:MAG: hypothetical protein AAF678_12740 [Pseudomonadota bacterium]
MMVNQRKTLSFTRPKPRFALGRTCFVLLTLGLCLAIAASPSRETEVRTDHLLQIGSSNLSVTGRVTHVRDGDTIEIGEIAIRLSALDCAERGTEQGTRATETMRALVHRGDLTCDLSGRKSYDRHIGQCLLADGRDLARVMIDTQTCHRFR